MASIKRFGWRLNYAHRFSFDKRTNGFPETRDTNDRSNTESAKARSLANRTTAGIVRPKTALKPTCFMGMNAEREAVMSIYLSSLKIFQHRVASKISNRQLGNCCLPYHKSR